jgi:hypothetical protein
VKKIAYNPKMKRLTVILQCLFFLLLSAAGYAQNATSSPSSRFGYGEMNENIPTAFRGMGGVAAG